VRPRDKKKMEANLGYLTSPLDTFLADSLKSSTTTPAPWQLACHTQPSKAFNLPNRATPPPKE